VTGPRSTRPPGPRVSPRTAADLTGIPRPELDDLIRRGVIRTERIGRRVFLDLDDAERAAKGWEGGG
jgi:excisionase family DNA binding protein